MFKAIFMLILTLPSSKSVSKLSENGSFLSEIVLATSRTPTIFSLDVTNVSLEQRHDLLALDEQERAVLLTIVLLNLTVILVFQLLLARQAWKNGVMSRPINLLLGNLESKLVCAILYYRRLF